MSEQMDARTEIESAGKTIAAAIDRFSEKVCAQLAEANKLHREQLRVQIAAAATATQQVELYKRDIAERSDPKILAERMRQGVEAMMQDVQQPQRAGLEDGPRLPRHGKDRS